MCVFVTRRDQKEPTNAAVGPTGEQHHQREVATVSGPASAARCSRSAVFLRGKPEILASEFPPFEQRRRETMSETRVWP